MRVLIVEGNKAVANFLAIHLQGWGFEIHVSHSGLDALDAAERFRPAVMLTDVQLPDIDGFSLIERLVAKNEAKNATFITMTASADRSLAEKAKAVGAAHHFLKPIDIMEIRNLILAQEARIETELIPDPENLPTPVPDPSCQ